MVEPGNKIPKMVRTTYLEQYRPPAKYPPNIAHGGTAIMRVNDIPLSFYRYLYGQIGQNHGWYIRNQMDDYQLSQEVHGNNIKIWVIYREGAPAGFAELEFEGYPASIDIVYFGILPEFQGRKMGKWFFGQILMMAWDEAPEKLTLSTNNLDSPLALPMYQKFGFAPVSIKEIPAAEYY